MKIESCECKHVQYCSAHNRTKPRAKAGLSEATLQNGCAASPDGCPCPGCGWLVVRCVTGIGNALMCTTTAREARKDAYFQCVNDIVRQLVEVRIIARLPSAR